VYPASFEYFAPASLDEALSILERYMDLLADIVGDVGVRARRERDAVLPTRSARRAGTLSWRRTSPK
jgi:hypothetical protein